MNENHFIRFSIVFIKKKCFIDHMILKLVFQNLYQNLIFIGHPIKLNNPLVRKPINIVIIAAH